MGYDVPILGVAFAWLPDVFVPTWMPEDGFDTSQYMAEMYFDEVRPNGYRICLFVQKRCGVEGKEWKAVIGRST